MVWLVVVTIATVAVPLAHASPLVPLLLDRHVDSPIVGPVVFVPGDSDRWVLAIGASWAMLALLVLLPN